jgi:hypothetical protein
MRCRVESKFKNSHIISRRTTKYERTPSVLDVDVVCMTQFCLLQEMIYRWHILYPVMWRDAYHCPAPRHQISPSLRGSDFINMAIPQHRPTQQLVCMYDHCVYNHQRTYSFVQIFTCGFVPIKISLRWKWAKN